MLTLRTSSLCVAVCAVIAVTARAQAPSTPMTPAAVYASFERVLPTLNRPVADLERIWPTPVTGGDAVTHLKLTAAHAIHVTVFSDPERRNDSTTRVTTVALVEQFTDSLAFRDRIVTVLAELTGKHGAPNDCSLPLGPPAYLSIGQNPARIWHKGLQGALTVIDWEVTVDRKYVLTTFVGKYAGTLGRTLPCTAKLP
jgi:hypothetical protein